MASDVVRLIAGLGNPGPKYAGTRHNAGAWLVEMLAREAGQPLREERKFLGYHSKVIWQGQDLHLLFPTTYMNHSGRSLKALSDFFRIPPESILVAHDELDLPPGTARFKKGGGHGGHNGLRDIISHLGSREFYRLRVGVGHPGDSKQVINYVLSNAGKKETDAIEAALEETVRALPDGIRGDWSAAMNRLHAFHYE